MPSFGGGDLGVEFAIGANESEFLFGVDSAPSETGRSAMPAQATVERGTSPKILRGILSLGMNALCFGVFFHKPAVGSGVCADLWRIMKLLTETHTDSPRRMMLSIQQNSIT